MTLESAFYLRRRGGMFNGPSRRLGIALHLATGFHLTLIVVHYLAEPPALPMRGKSGSAPSREVPPSPRHSIRLVLS